MSYLGPASVWCCFCSMMMFRILSWFIFVPWLKFVPRKYAQSYMYIRYLRVILWQKYKLWYNYIPIFGQNGIFGFAAGICLGCVQFYLEPIGKDEKDYGPPADPHCWKSCITRCRFWCQGLLLWRDCLLLLPLIWFNFPIITSYQPFTWVW